MRLLLGLLSPLPLLLLPVLHNLVILRLVVSDVSAGSGSVADFVIVTVVIVVVVTVFADVCLTLFIIVLDVVVSVPRFVAVAVTVIVAVAKLGCQQWTYLPLRT